MPFLDKTGLAHLWNQITARLNGKADMSDLNNLETSLATQIDNLDAAAVGALPDTTNIPDSLADLSSDPTHRTVTDTEKSAWDAKSNFSGSYNDLTNKPTIPSITGLATEAYADNAATTAANALKNDLLNGAGGAYDTLKELGDLIDDNKDAIDALEVVAAGKANVSDLTAHTESTSNPHSVTAAQVGAVPTSRTVNSKALSSDITLSASDVGAVPTSRTVNGKALSSNISLSASDVGARASTWVPSASDITSGTLSSDRLSTIPITKGGTGGTTAKAAEYNLLKDLSETTTAVSDNSQIVFKYSEPSATKGALLYKKASTIYDYIKGKLTATDVGALPQQCAYYASGATVTVDTCNDPFALFASSLAGSTLLNLLGNPGFVYVFTLYYASTSYKLQIAFPYNVASSAVAVRQSNGGTWKAWTRIDNHAPLTSDQYGTALPAAGTAGRIFFKKVT